MKTNRKLTQELSSNNNQAESQKTKSTNTKTNEQRTELKQKQQCGGVDNEKLDNDKL
jgi:hypothetical protein